MTWFKKISALLILAVWLPCTVHCQLKCASACSKDDCSKHCVCQWVASGGYETTQIQPAAVMLTTVLFQPTIDLEIELPIQNVECAKVAHSPPDLPKAWQFVFRAASTPRAPSIAS